MATIRRRRYLYGLFAAALGLVAMLAGPVHADVSPVPTFDSDPVVNPDSPPCPDCKVN
jgi:hypothetical protein